MDQLEIYNNKLKKVLYSLNNIDHILRTHLWMTFLTFLVSGGKAKTWTFSLFKTTNLNTLDRISVDWTIPINSLKKISI